MKNAFVLLFLLGLISCKKETVKETTLKDDVEVLASDAYEGRQTGSEGEQKAATYISKRFKDIGLEAKGTNGFTQAFSFKPKTDPHQEVNYTVKDGDSTITGTNVIGMLNNNA